ncbi:MAG TPA: hypothetical protein VF719_12270 [Abditibacteriaceae bacterium]|jgi:hypothetical protein
MKAHKIDRNGVSEVEVPADLAAKVEAQIAEEQAEIVNTSTAAALLADLRSRRSNLIEAHEIEGQTWFLLSMDYGTTNEVAARTTRDGDGTLRLDIPDVFRSFVAATLQCGVVKGMRDPSPFFNPKKYWMENAYGSWVETTELDELMKEPGASNLVATLFDKLTDMNPKLWPQKKTAMEQASRMLDGKPLMPKGLSHGSVKSRKKRASSR